METLADKLIEALRKRAGAFSPGDQVAPCAALWFDAPKLWQSVVEVLQKACPEIYVLGDYSPSERTGPAIWLRCIEARVVPGAPDQGVMPIFYLPGLSRDDLRDPKEWGPESKERSPLVDLCLRGDTWRHTNGKDWTPYAFLTSNTSDGLGLNIAGDQGTKDALQRALITMLDEPLETLRGHRLDAEFFNGLLAPDSTKLVLQWFDGPEALKASLEPAQWKAFCDQCKKDFKFDPTSEGLGQAAKLLAARQQGWGKVWTRFCEAPAKYKGVVNALESADGLGMFDSAEVWPSVNHDKEVALALELKALTDLPQHQAIERVKSLEAEHALRRNYPWAVLGLSPLALILEPLSRLAELCQTTPGGASTQAFGDYYKNAGWKVDAAALDVMIACRDHDSVGDVLKILRAMYMPWLDATARHLQSLVANGNGSMEKHNPPVPSQAGCVVVFADGLRMDIAHRLKERLESLGNEAALEWEWSTVPSVTATAKPAASPLDRQSLMGKDGSDEFSPRLVEGEGLLTQDKFKVELQRAGWQCLSADAIGDASGWAWVEAGTLDKRGHSEGWKLAFNVESEVNELASRIRALIGAGWSEVVVVTDHGWLLVPGGMEKIQLNMKLADHRWGRCAAIKPDIPVDANVLKWTWNPAVSIASPRGVGCFRAGIEYSHGGVSLQEMVTPVLHVTGTKTGAGTPRIMAEQWTNARCRVTVANPSPGCQLDIRDRENDPSTSLLADQRLVNVPDTGQASLFLEDDSSIGRAAFIVLLDSSSTVIHSRSTNLGA